MQYGDARPLDLFFCERIVTLPRPALSEAETRELILSEAYSLFKEIGYRKTTIGDIAKACGFSPANVHKHFGTKSDINQAIASVMMDEKISEAKKAVAKRRSPSMKLRVFVATIYESTLESFRHDKRVFETLSSAAEEKWEVVRNYRLTLKGMLTDIIREGCEAGEFTSPNIGRTADAIHMSLIAVFHPANIVEMLDEPDAADVDTITDFLLAGLRAN